MENVLGVLGIFVFCICMVALAAGVTWVVIKVSPTPGTKKPSG